MALCGMVPNITQLLGVDLFGLISMIEKAARTVSQNEEAKRRITDRAWMIKNLLEELQQLSRSFEHPEMWKPMKELKSILRRAYRLIIGYQHSSYMYKFCCGSDLSNEFESVQKGMDIWYQHLTDLKRDIQFELTVHTRRLHGNSNTIKQDGAHLPPAGSPASHLKNDNRGKLVGDLGEFQLLAEPSDIVEDFTIKSQISRCCCWCPNISYKGTGLTKFGFSQLAHATNYFSLENKIGFGGSSYVYKGQLKMGLEVAVKRASYEGKIPFKHFQNEIELIPKLQHANIVKLQGYCIRKGERILVFEYMPNGSLDNFIYEGERARESLEWPKRRQIIEGIAQGAKYLHQLCEPHIIHGDLKPGNILLDSDFKPKICDFGISKALKPGADEDCTGIVTGSRGFIAPEYIGQGCLSIKSDVYSFGVTLLQIISRKSLPPPPLELSAESRHYGPLNKWAWDLCAAGELLEFIDPSLHDEPQNAEIMRWVKIALLCVQEDPEKRPSMSDVLEMLGSEDDIQKQPSRPAYY
ncbi:hypothetical protein SEVIR_8G235400v4 [Setaria viridis]|uniref:Protein kinase domain-containing protein n=1 Tax=Setaria viridis TaxID=4556 RepID=A0A4U6TM13_SETVI|nr:cysteine-rich receptor-like protein kinase 45 [Setaria viridis]XP_034606606.1 cysteine-rich receptor-like protein kinase 45 [Setaria viridis]TKW02284.1 hypothetical protein SEVIR_8G235400v2 [Setaria viridis]